MASMPISIPITIKVKGLKKLTTLVEALTEKVGTLMTAAQGQQLSADLANIDADITRLITNGEAAQASNAAAYTALQEQLTALQGSIDADVNTRLQAAIAEYEAAASANLQGVVDEASRIAGRVPEDTPTPDPEPTPEPEPAPEPDPNAPVDPNV